MVRAEVKAVHVRDGGDQRAAEGGIVIPREREVAVRFILSRKADNYNNQQVELRLEEPVEGTSHHTRYQSVRYTIRRSFTSEFDF